MVWDVKTPIFWSDILHHLSIQWTPLKNNTWRLYNFQTTKKIRTHKSQHRSCKNFDFKMTDIFWQSKGSDEQKVKNCTQLISKVTKIQKKLQDFWGNYLGDSKIPKWSCCPLEFVCCSIGKSTLSFVTPLLCSKKMYSFQRANSVTHLSFLFQCQLFHLFVSTLIINERVTRNLKEDQKVFICKLGETPLISCFLFGSTGNNFWAKGSCLFIISFLTSNSEFVLFGWAKK